MTRGGRGRRAEEVKISGRHACRALFERWPDRIIRAYITEAALPGFRDLLKFCAQSRRAYHVVEAEELERVSGSAHHEGVCLLARHEPADLEGLLGEQGPMTLVALDGVENPHNLGAILRTAAHFGVRAVLVEPQGELTAAARRVAEGGATWVDVVTVRDLVEALDRLADADFEIVATAGETQASLYEHRFAPRTVVVLGNERDGVSRAIRAASHQRLAIPGTGQVESLNVAAAAAVVLAERWRQAGPGPRRR
jgi:TrmH RNA methyltransferase